MLSNPHQAATVCDACADPAARQSAQIKTGSELGGNHEASIGNLMVEVARDDRGATTLEWALLLAAIGIPSYFLLNGALNLLVAHYQLMTMINSLPFP